MKRKMVSFILCIAMCMALAIPAFAVELSPYATDEVGNFSQMIEFAFSDNVEGRFRYSYNDAAGNVVDGIVIKEISTDGTTKLNFVEGDKSDKVEIDSIIWTSSLWTSTGRRSFRWRGLERNPGKIFGMPSSTAALPPLSSI